MREGAKSGVTRLERMKHGSGIKNRDDKSSGIEIRMTETLAKINPITPFLARRRRSSISVFYWHSKQISGPPLCPY